MAQMENPIARLKEVIAGIDLAILTTIRPDGTLHSCPMATHGIDASGAFWLISGSNTEKVEAVRTIQRVNLCFAEPARQRYVSVSGFCELVRDRALAKQLWKPSYSLWFAGGPEDPDLILMKIIVQQAEYWDPAHSRMVTLSGFSSAAIV